MVLVQRGRHLVETATADGQGVYCAWVTDTQSGAVHAFGRGPSQHAAVEDAIGKLRLDQMPPSMRAEVEALIVDARAAQ